MKQRSPVVTRALQLSRLVDSVRIKDAMENHGNRKVAQPANPILNSIRTAISFVLLSGTSYNDVEHLSKVDKDYFLSLCMAAAMLYGTVLGAEGRAEEFHTRFVEMLESVEEVGLNREKK